MSTETIRVLQLSDTHFIEADEMVEGGFGYDTSEAFDAVFDHIAAETSHPATDLIVVTGDVTDHGRPAQYRLAADAFGRFDEPVNVCPGNHDLDTAFSVGMGRPGIATSRAIEAGPWCFLFVDSNRGVMAPDSSGRLVDPSAEDRLHGNGSLGEAEASWIHDACASTEAEHVFVWVHHPPGSPIGLSADAPYLAEWQAVLESRPEIRGFGAGHTHVPGDYLIDGRPVFMCPALKNNFDLDAKTMLPPGYRSYEFHADGSIAAATHLVDDDRWPRHPLGRAVLSLLNGELSFDEFNEIVARRQQSS